MYRFAVGFFLLLLAIPNTASAQQTPTSDFVPNKESFSFSSTAAFSNESTDFSFTLEPSRWVETDEIIGADPPKGCWYTTPYTITKTSGAPMQIFSYVDIFRIEGPFSPVFQDDSATREMFYLQFHKNHGDDFWTADLTSAELPITIYPVFDIPCKADPADLVLSTRSGKTEIPLFVSA